ncbi:MAG: GNAT family N-acetyltransferase [Atribacterota bacterium]|nr:GNAT family N-acetyltransferase [Atribacterota bacterium]
MIGVVAFQLVTLTCKEFEEKLESLIELYQKAYRELPEYAYQHQERVRGYLLWLWRGDPAGFLVALDKGKIVGFISIHSEWEEGQEIIGEIHEFVVDPEYQGKGGGDFLFASALEYARVQGRSRVGLWVGEKNAKALLFYAHRGFEKKGQWGKWVRMFKEIKTS